MGAYISVIYSIDYGMLGKLVKLAVVWILTLKWCFTGIIYQLLSIGSE